MAKDRNRIDEPGAGYALVWRGDPWGGSSRPAHEVVKRRSPSTAAASVVDEVALRQYRITSPGSRGVVGGSTRGPRRRS
jgi:hypothetical protein